MFVLVKIIDHGADVICHKAGRGLRHSIIRHNVIIRFSKALRVDKRKMTYVKKSLDLSSCGKLHGNAFREYLEVARVIHSFISGKGIALLSTSRTQTLCLCLWAESC